MLVYADAKTMREQGSEQSELPVHVRALQQEGHLLRVPAAPLGERRPASVLLCSEILKP